MTQIVGFRGDTFRWYVASQPATLVASEQLLPLQAPLLELTCPPEAADLPVADFMAVSNTMALNTAFLVSAPAWSVLLKDRFGVLERTVAGAPENYRLVQVCAQLDVIDFDLSIEHPSIPGLFVGLHVHAVADQLAGSALFTPVGARLKLLCSDEWMRDCRSAHFTGLSFEPASVG